MSKLQNTYNPDYAIPTGWVLEEQLEIKELSQAAFARSCGRSAKLISQIVNGTAPVEPQTALEFERVLGLDASIWMSIESSYRLFLAKEAEQRELKKNIQWAKNFPIRDLKELGIVSKDSKDESLVSKLLNFLEIGSTDVWHKQIKDMSPQLQFRKQNSHTLSPESLSVWLKLGELEARKQNCEQYDRSKFIQNLKIIRNLTTENPEEFFPKMMKLCNDSGVALAILPQLTKLPVCGIARWLTPHKPLISLTLRYKTNDHFWFSFFHEAAHILLHSKKDVFVDTSAKNDDEPVEEKEANSWAANFLIPDKEFDSFAKPNLRKQEIIDFAEKVNIHPAIVVGRLQKQNFLDWNNHCSNLKTKFELSE